VSAALRLCFFVRRIFCRAFFAPNARVEIIRVRHVSRSGAGLPDFLLVQNFKTGNNVPKYQELYQMSIKYNYIKTVKWTTFPKNIPTSFIARPSKIWIFGLKTNHLATLRSSFVTTVRLQSGVKGCQMAYIFSHQKNKFVCIWEGLGMEYVGIFPDYWVNFTIIGYILWPFGIFCGH
jgi:hypothetical protein